jgi:hypothetical protein
LQSIASTNKVGQLSQNVRLDFSRPEDKFVILIENLAWDSDRVAMAMKSSSSEPEPNETTSPNNFGGGPCLQFYNEVLENLGPIIKITDGFSPTGFSTRVMDTASRGLLTNSQLDKMACEDSWMSNSCLSGQKVLLLERILQNSFYFNNTVYIEGDSFGKTYEAFLSFYCIDTYTHERNCPPIP